MSASTIEALSSGTLNLIQDRGRDGHLASGVSRSGAMDEPALVTANLLVGNGPDAAAIEINVFPMRLRVNGEVTFACTGAQSRVSLDGITVPTWSAIQAHCDQVITIEPPTLGARTYIAFAGGIDSKQILGSRSTDLKARFGGHEGRGLKRADVLALGEPKACAAKRSGRGVVPTERTSFLEALKTGQVRVRVIASAEYGSFADESRALFEEHSFEITSEANRVGYRLQGPALKLKEPLELLSHGIIPGTIQVPSNGQPIIQMAEANTCGGYPKIATVVQTDLWRLAQAPIGCTVRFRLVDVEEAIEEIRFSHKSQERVLAALR